MTLRVDVKPEFFSWAVERARMDWDAVSHRFAALPGWRSGSVKPTYKQLESFAAATHAPRGFFFLPSPPEEKLPLPDFRTFEGIEVSRPSANLLDTIYVCQQRQEWFRDFARSNGFDELRYVGSASLATRPEEVARTISETLGFDLEKRKACSNWEEALRHLVERCEENGILVMVSGVVGNNTHRVLDPEEFRGFCIPDALAPLVFVNGTDSKSAQMFTLVHELAHLWLGEGGVSNPTLSSFDSRHSEVWCNAVAAEVLVPLTALRELLIGNEALDESVRRLTKIFKVSSLVVLRRLLDAGLLGREEFWTSYGAELARLRSLKSEKSSGGNFYNTEAVRVSRRFATALLVSTFEGNTLFRDASRLLGIKSAATMDRFASELGVL